MSATRCRSAEPSATRSTAPAPTRLLMAGDFPQSPAKLIGGIQAVTWELVKQLAALPELQVHVAACEKFWQAPPARSWSTRTDRYSAAYFRSPRRLPHVLSAWTIDAQFVRYQARVSAAQLIHAHGQSGYAVAAIRSDLPHLITVHGVQSREKRAAIGSAKLSSAQLRQTLWTRLEDWCLANARHIVVISPHVRTQIAARTSAQLHEIANPVTRDFFELERPTRAPTTLLTVGWLNPRKRQHLIVRALALVRAQGHDVSLRIVGNVEAEQDQRRDELRRLTRELGVGHAVHFLHDLQHEQLLDEYRHADLYVHAAEEESSPMAVAQAMAAGLPSCAIEIPGLHHLLRDREAGRYASEPTPASLAATICAVLDAPVTLPAMGLAARHAARRFRPAVVARQTSDLYNEILLESRASRR